MRDGREWSLDMACAVLSGFVNVCVYVNVRCEHVMCVLMFV